MKYTDFLNEIGHQRNGLVSRENFLKDKKIKIEQQISQLGAFDIESLKTKIEEKKRILNEKKAILNSIEKSVKNSNHIIPNKDPWIIEQCEESFWKRHTVPLIIAVILVVLFFAISSAVS